jgi:hypothetical protein
MRPTACGALLACALLALAGTAHAQNSTYVEQRTSKGQDISFDDDPLAALTGQPIGSQFTGMHPARRFDLMRLRTTFVGAMLKSVEAI